MSRKAVLIMLAVMFLLGLTATTALAQAGDPIQAAADKYFTGGTKTIKAADLFANLNDGDKTNDPYIIDLRAAADFASGYIAGSINVTPKDLFTAAELAKLPKNKPIVVACYSGQNSAQAVAPLRMLGYDAYSLLYGVSAWGYNDKVKYAFTADQSGKYPVSKDVAQLPVSGEAPKPLASTVEAAATAYFNAGAKTIKAADVFANLNDGDKANDPLIIDLRSSADYALGHVPGAVNVAAKDMFTAATLAKLPKSKQIVAYCYSGQTSGQVTPALRMLGYDAFSMLYGMPSWAIVEGVSSGVWDMAKNSGKYPLQVSAQPAAAPAAAPAPVTVPKTGAPLFALLLVGLGLTGAGLTLRNR